VLDAKYRSFLTSLRGELPEIGQVLRKPYSFIGLLLDE
jgi:hypothetical protein